MNLLDQSNMTAELAGHNTALGRIRTTYAVKEAVTPSTSLTGRIDVAASHEKELQLTHSHALQSSRDEAFEAAAMNGCMHETEPIFVLRSGRSPQTLQMVTPESLTGMEAQMSPSTDHAFRTQPYSPSKNRHGLQQVWSPVLWVEVYSVSL